MKYTKSHQTAGSGPKIFLLMLASLAGTLLLSMTMVSLVVKWLAHS